MMKLETRLFLADLTHLDCAWFDPQVGLSGETWRVDAEVGGELGQDGMLCDFGVIKSTLKRALDDSTDHRLLIARPQLADLARQGAQIEAILETHAGEQTRYQAPEQSFAILGIESLGATELAEYLAEQLLPQLPSNIQHLQLWLTPAHTEGPYRYCHGLRQHSGNCQRMAHGHRARLEIQINDQRQAALELTWHQRLDGRYIGAAADLKSTHNARHQFAYTGSQGEFELEIPSTRAYVIEAEPTVESITAHMAINVAREYPGRKIQCRAFEGIGKGAVVGCHAEGTA